MATDMQQGEAHVSAVTRVPVGSRPTWDYDTEQQFLCDLDLRVQGCTLYALNKRIVRGAIQLLSDGLSMLAARECAVAMANAKVDSEARP